MLALLAAFVILASIVTLCLCRTAAQEPRD